MKKVLILSGSSRKGAKEMGVIYGTGVYEKGKIINTRAYVEAYKMGKSV